MSKRPGMTLLLPCVIVFGVLRLVSPARAMDFPGPAPGKPVAEVRDDQMQIGNAAIAARWSLAGGSLRPVQVQNRLTGQTVDLRGCESFRLSLAGGKQLAASDLKVVGRPSVQSIAASPQRRSWQGISPANNWRRGWPRRTAAWKSSGGPSCARRATPSTSRSRCLAKNRPILVQAMQLIELPRQGATVVGSVAGSPLVAGELFFAYEHPDAQAEVGDRARCVLKRGFSLEPGQAVSQVSAIGAVPKGQLRRGFLYYVERERAHPYRPFLHFNSWYDEGCGAHHRSRLFAGRANVRPRVDREAWRGDGLVRVGRRLGRAQDPLGA